MVNVCEHYTIYTAVVLSVKIYLIYVYGTFCKILYYCTVNKIYLYIFVMIDGVTPFKVVQLIQ